MDLISPVYCLIWEARGKVAAWLTENLFMLVVPIYIQVSLNMPCKEQGWGAMS